MVNGVLLIIAAVLFAVVYLFGKMGTLWLWIGCFYFAAGVGDLTIYAIKEKKKLHSANKEAQKNAKQAEEARKQAESVRKPEVTAALPEPMKEENNG